jgi:tRNA G18 (ribose-2'-O)-methylase SpoU
MNEPDTDTRNVIDVYRGQSVEAIIADLDTSRSQLEIAVENLERDFNMGTIIRNANAFNVAKVHVIGRKQWNKRGAMKTDAYLHVYYYRTSAEFFEAMRRNRREVIAVDIVDGAVPLSTVVLPENAVLVFGAEGPGLSDELLTGASKVVHIEQFGSTRSVNVGVASGIAMYAWMQQHRLQTPQK